MVVADDDDPLLVTPEVSVTAGGGVVEGGDVSFTVTADPAPSAPLQVSVTVSQDGDFGVSTGSQTVTVPTSGSVTVTLITTDDDEDEPDGSVSLSLNAGDGYIASSVQDTASVVVADDDDPPLVVEPEISVEVADNDDPPPVDLPVVSVSDASIAEGELGWLSPLEFTLTLSEPSDQNITVNYRVYLGRTSPSDHYGGSSRVTIWAGRILSAIVIMVVDDRLREGDETLEIELIGADGAIIDTTAATAVGTIIDND